METIRPNDPRPVSLKPYVETVRQSLPKKEADMLVTITGLLEDFLGTEILIPNRLMLWDLPRRFRKNLVEKGFCSNTTKNYTYRLKKALAVLCQGEEDLCGLDSPPNDMPFFEKSTDPVEQRLHLAYRLHSDWRKDQGIPISSNSKSVFRRYQKFLLSKSNCSYATARLRYGDLQTFWAAKVETWELPLAEIPEMPATGSPQIGLVKDQWPPLIREEFDWFFRCCRGQEKSVPFMVKNRLGKAAETNLKSDISLYLGYLTAIRQEDIEGWNLRTILSRKEVVKSFLEWHRENRTEGRAATIHQRILRDFAMLLDWAWSEPVATVYRDWASQLRVERVRPKFHETIDDHGRLLSAVQEALDKVDIEARKFRLNQISGATPKAILDMASRFQDVLMFALFSVVPLRESNMVGLEIGKSLLQTGLDRYEIRINSIAFKSKRPFTIQFPTMLIKPLEDFLANWRPYLNFKSDSLLYHTRAGGPLLPKAVNDRMIRLGKKLLGIRVNPHHFRMLVASAYLAEHPQDFDQIRQLLGHRFISTTIQSYTHVFCLNASRKATQFAKETSPTFNELGTMLMPNREAA